MGAGVPKDMHPRLSQLAGLMPDADADADADADG